MFAQWSNSTGTSIKRTHGSREMSYTKGQKPESAASPRAQGERAAEMHTSIRHEKPAVSRQRLLSLATPPGSPKQVLRSFDLRYFSFLAPSIDRKSVV